MTYFSYGFRVIVLSILFVSIANVYSKAHAQNSLVFSKPGPHDFHAQISEDILKEAYARIGITVTTKEFPGERALHESNSGALDGEVNRIAGIVKKYTDLRIVPVAINALKGTAFTKNRTIKIKTWEDLRSHSIALRKGAKYAEYGTSGMNVISATTNKMVFRMLDRNRVEVVISTALEGSLTIKNLGIKDIFMMEQPLVTLKLFHYLHKKHEDLIESVTKALEEMSQEGRIQKIRTLAFRQLIN